MFKSKYFRMGFFGFLAAAFLFYTYDAALFDYRLKKIPLTELLEQKLKAPPSTTLIKLTEDRPLVTLTKGKITNYKSLKELIKGKPTILLVWSPTCGLCPEQMKKLEVFKRRHKKINIVMIGLYGDINEGAKKYAQNCSDIFIYDNDPRIKLLHILAADLIQSQEIGFPFYVFFNTKGEIIARSAGSIAWEQLGDDIASARFN